MSKIIISAQITIKSVFDGEQGDSGYTIHLTNNNMNFPADYKGEIKSEIVDFCDIEVYQGFNSVPFVIGQIEQPQGLSIQTESQRIIITALKGSSLSPQGTIFIPILINGVSFQSTISWIKLNNGVTKEDINEELTEIKDSVTELSSIVDKNTQSIKDKISRTEYITVQKPDGTEVEKTVINALTESIQDVNSITNTVSELSTTVNENYTELTEKVSEQKQTSDGFYQGVKESYLKSINGAINILKESNIEQTESSGTNLIAEYLLYENIMPNRTYTIIFFGSINSGQYFNVKYGNTDLCNINTNEDQETLYMSVFETPSNINEVSKLFIYNSPAGTATQGKIAWACLFDREISDTSENIGQWVSPPQEYEISSYELGTTIQQTSENITLTALQSDSMTDIIDSRLEISSDQIESNVRKYINNRPIKYIRDYLDGSNIDPHDKWIGCKVYSGGEVISNHEFAVNENGEFIDENGNVITTDEDKVRILTLNTDVQQFDSTSADLSTYINNPLMFQETNSSETPIEEKNNYIIKSADIESTDPESGEIVYASNLHYIEIEFENIQYFIDYIEIYHLYDDNDPYQFNHYLEISEDGEEWESLFDSDLSTSYTEEASGRTYYISSNAMNNQISSIKQTAESIVSSVSGKFVTQDEYNTDVVEVLKSVLVQTADGWKMSFDRIINNPEQQELVKKWIDFKDGSIVFGDEKNPVSLTLKNDRLSFNCKQIIMDEDTQEEIEKSVEVAYIDDNGFNINEGHIKDKLIVEDELNVLTGGILRLGNFAFKPRKNNNLSFGIFN